MKKACISWSGTAKGLLAIFALQEEIDNQLLINIKD